MAKKRKTWKSNKPTQPPELILPPDIRAALGEPPDPRWLQAADRESKKCRERFESGDESALFDAIALWSEFFPAWAKDAFRKAWLAYGSYEAATLDQAFGIERPKGQHIGKAREREKLRFQILFRVYDLHHRKNAPLDAVTFASVGDELGIAGSTVAKIFGEPASDELRELLRILHFSDYYESD